MSEVQRLAFPPRSQFFSALKSRVDGYFTERGLAQTGNARLYLKAVFALILTLGSYAMLVWGVEHWWSAALAALVLVQSMALLAFSVMHDGCHGSFSQKRWINWVAGAMMDVMGSSNVLWRQKHNLLHHTYTNVDGRDDDICIGALLRLSPNQPRHRVHRFQHWYAPALYSLLSLYLLLYSDWQRMFSGKIGETPMQARQWWEWPYFLFSKAFYLTYALIVPMLYHPVWQVLLVFVGVHLVFGLTLSIVFQLAHIVPETEFPGPAEGGKMPYEWAEHQLRTTANFAVGKPLATFYTGGLNYQVEHHLFHKVSHVHYPAISRIVRDTCAEYDIRYLDSGSTWQALAAHFRFLRQMGHPSAA
ncbi:MAG TPA: acyl-CoA desaturase [Chitinolyticbacter sp.]|nr:acyl-CoA desaturase [Chitinolyticbacter sp.]